MSTDPTVKVFVYGTLKQGFYNHTLLEEFSHTKQEALTVGKLLMYTNNSYPAVVRDSKYVRSKEAGQVFGEVYTVDLLTLARLDMLEGHPNHYVREYEPVHIIGAQPETIVPQMYFQRDTDMTLRVLPDPETSFITFE